MSVERFKPKHFDKYLPLNFPERSCLYPLEPYGLGTPTVESLTSYVARLAAVHRVPTGVLLGQLVAPIVSQAVSQSAARVSHSFFRTFFTDTGAWNGTGNMALTSVEALERLTLRHDLGFLTFLAWSQVLPYRGLLRCRKAWCPACYEEWDRLGVALHEPLLWSLKIVTVCPRHQQLLHSECPFCHHSLYWLEWNSRPAYCSRCQSWLGENFTIASSSDTLWNNSEWEWQNFIIESLGEILAIAPNLPFSPPRENISVGVNRCINAVFQGNAKAFAEVIYASASVPGDWRKGEAIPQLHLLLRICYCLRIPLHKFLIGEVVVDEPVRLMALPPSQRVKRKNRTFDSGLVQRTLAAVLQENPPKSMKQVASEMGYDPGDLSKYFPDLCYAISERYRCQKRHRRH